MRINKGETLSSPPRSARTASRLALPLASPRFGAVSVPLGFYVFGPLIRQNWATRGVFLRSHCAFIEVGQTQFGAPFLSGSLTSWKQSMAGHWWPGHQQKDSATASDSAGPNWTIATAEKFNSFGRNIFIHFRFIAELHTYWQMSKVAIKPSYSSNFPLN